MTANKLELPKKTKLKKKSSADPIADEIEFIEKQLVLLQDQVNRIESAFSKTAHYNGTANLISEFGFERYKPTRKDMKKHIG